MPSGARPAEEGRARTLRGRQRRGQLVDHAARRFAENGYHPTSVSDIVGGLGVGKGVFYWYFSSKEELFCEILREAQHDLRRRQQQAIGTEPDPVRRIELGIRASLAWLDEHRHLATLFSFARSDDRFRPVVRQGEEVAVADTMRHVKDGIVAARIRDADPVALTHAIIGVTNHLHRVMVLDHGGSHEDAADAAVAFCLDGLLAR
ncbi:MAG TPA: TetR/AcrR family transcriptional regulator [Acidimicrobiales bacterium]|jgi:AcrR family transcriptional regulator|nr:TetR/AcrR family transcriptional regulator [Acidimicrobiales bacterium]